MFTKTLSYIDIAHGAAHTVYSLSCPWDLNGLHSPFTGSGCHVEVRKKDHDKSMRLFAGCK